MRTAGVDASESQPAHTITHDGSLARGLLAAERTDSTDSGRMTTTSLTHDREVLRGSYRASKKRGRWHGGTHAGSTRARRSRASIGK